jgi:hypothetical protein
MTPAALWRTVAFDLARKYPNVRRTIVAKLNEDEIGPSTANIYVLFRHLIHEPLTASTDIPTGRLPVIVINALDECGGYNGQHSHHRTGLLHTIKSWSSLPFKFKLVGGPSPAEAKMTSSMPCQQLGTGLSIFRLAKWSATDRQTMFNHSSNSGS